MGPQTTTARVGMMRDHLALTLRATDKLHFLEQSSLPDLVRIAELRREISDELREVFLLAAMAGLFRPSICGAALASPPAAAPEPDTVVPFPGRPPFVTTGEALQPTMGDVEALLAIKPDGKVIA